MPKFRTIVSIILWAIVCWLIMGTFWSPYVYVSPLKDMRILEGGEGRGRKNCEIKINFKTRNIFECKHANDLVISLIANERVLIDVRSCKLWAKEGKARLIIITDYFSSFSFHFVSCWFCVSFFTLCSSFNMNSHEFISQYLKLKITWEKETEQFFLNKKRMWCHYMHLQLLRFLHFYWLIRCSFSVFKYFVIKLFSLFWQTFKLENAQNT